jgi:hypothetical protein
MTEDPRYEIAIRALRWVSRTSLTPDAMVTVRHAINKCYHIDNIMKELDGKDAPTLDLYHEAITTKQEKLDDNEIRPPRM